MKKIVIGLSIIFLFGTVHAKKVFIGEPVTFTANEKPNIETYEWTFSDSDDTLTGPEIIYHFKEAGSQKITLTAITKDGIDEATTTKSVLVLNKGKPTAIIALDGNEVAGNYKEVKILEVDDLKFSSISKNGEGVTAKDKELNETWSVDGRTLFSMSQMGDKLKKPGEHTVKLIVSVPGNSNLRDDATFIVKTLNQKPEVAMITIIVDPHLGQKEITVLAGGALDPDVGNQPGDGIDKYIFEILEYGQVIASSVPNPANNKAIFSLNLPAGKHKLSYCVTVIDEYGAKTKKCEEKKEGYITVDEVPNNPPVLDAILPDSTLSVNVGEQLQIELIASDPDNDALTYKWLLEDKLVGSGRIFRHAFTEPSPQGEPYLLDYIISDGVASISSRQEFQTPDTSLESQITITVNSIDNNPPEVKIIGYYPSLTGDTNTIFKLYSEASDADNDSLDYFWEVQKMDHSGPDGEFALISRTKNFAYRFKEDGNYKVRIRVSDGQDGDTADEVIVVKPLSPNTRPDLIKILPEPEGGDTHPDADSNGEYTYDKNELIQLEVIAKDDDGDPIHYSWFLDGVRIGNGSTLRHRVKEAGVYKLGLWLNDGNIDEESEIPNYNYALTIKNKLPTTQIISFPESGTTQTQFHFDQETTNPDNDPLTYTWEISEGNEAPFQILETPSFNYRFEEKGTYNVKLIVDDGEEPVDDGSDPPNIAEVPIEVTAANTAPVIKKFNEFIPEEIKQNEKFEIEAVVSDAEQSPEELSYAWSLDGRSIGRNENPLRYTIKKSGSYILKLKVSDGIETVSEETKITVDNQEHTAEIVHFPSNGDTDTRFQFYPEVTNPDNDPLTYTWEIWQGDVRLEVKNVRSFTRRFEQADTYKIKLSVNDGTEDISATNNDITIKVDPANTAPEITNINQITNN